MTQKPVAGRPPAKLTDKPAPPARPNLAGNPPPKAKPADPPHDPRAAFAEFADGVTGRLEAAGEQLTALQESVQGFTTRIEAVERRSAQLAESEDVNKRFEELRKGEHYAELAERLQRLDERGARLEAMVGEGGGRRRGHPDHPGMPRWAIEAAEHADFAAFQSSDEKRAQLIIRLQNRMRIRRPAFGMSTVITDDDTVGDASLPVTAPGLTELLREPIGLVDIVRQVPDVHADIYQAMVEDQVSTSKLHSKVRVAGSGGTTPTNTIAVDNVEGFFVGQSIYVFTSAGRQGPEVITSITSTAGSEALNFATDEIDFDVAVGDLVAGDQYLATGEGNFKPARVLKASLKTVAMQTLASYIPTTRQRLRRTNVFDLMAWAADRLPADLRENLEYHLLYGSGVAADGQLQGFLHATYLVNTDTWSTSMAVGDNRADLILHSAAQIPGKGQIWAVLHRLDWRRITGAKDSAGNYVHGAGEGPAIIDTPGLKAIGDVRVAISNQVAQTTGLVLDPMAASDLAPEGDAELIVGYVNTQLIENESTILYEEGYAHLIKNALQAYRKVDFDGPPSA